MPVVLPPVPGPADQWFWDGVADGKLLFQRCSSCGTLRHPPSPMCGECHSLEWEPEAASGRGTVYTWIVSHHPTQPDHEPRIVMHAQMIGLAGAARKFLHVRHCAIQQSIHRRMQMGQLEQAQGEQISRVGLAGQETAA